MAFTRYTVALALGALIFGSLNTIMGTWLSMQGAAGTEAPSTIWGKLNQENETVHLFDHPFIMCLVMFLGEFLCLPAHLINRRRKAIPQSGDASLVEKGTFWFAIPGCCDILGTGVMYAGLCLSSASIFQMLRGSVVVFTAILSCTWLGRKIHGYQWFAVLLVGVGITIVGTVSLNNIPTGKDQTGVLVGDILIILAQIITAVQMCVEEKLITKYQPAPLKVVGLEGLFGFVVLSTFLTPMYFLKIDGARFENVPDALAQMGNNKTIVIASGFFLLSIAFFNSCGIGITKELSCSHRMVLDTLRTFVVWTASLLIGWESFSLLQLLGFSVVSMGIAMYNEIITAKWLFTYPADGTQSFCGDADHGSFLGNLDGEKKAVLPMSNQ